MTHRAKFVAVNTVVSLSYILIVEEQIIDTTPTPIQFVFGAGRILPALENALLGMLRNESKEIFIPFSQGYGAYDPRMVATVSRSQFPSDFVFLLGGRLTIRDKDFMWYDAAITAIGPEDIELDLNHPLAGKDLLFNATVVDIRHATDTEIESGDVEN